MISNAKKLTNFETIYCSSSSIIYRAFDKITNRKLILKTLNRELYDSASLAKLKNEYRLLKELHSRYVVEAYDFLNIENHFSMLIEDFGAVSLDRHIKTSPIDLREFLNIALQTTRCLDHIHNHQIIHKDINPSNIIYNPASGIIKLIDFGIASEFSYQTMEAVNPNKLEGSLPYISPEQTGRMNRPVDYRTDFYSLGITFYELACGALPFISSDPAEIVHFHIAQAPPSAHEINPHIPPAVGRIIAKLMAKAPEERYKNARGIIFDLHKCLEQLDNGVIEEFELGSRDISDKFEVPKKLYGRESELHDLLESFENTRRGKAEFILIGGYSGIGKTSLVNQLHKPVIREHGIFISGKYDQFNRNAPYSACFHAVDQFCRYILSEPAARINFWKERILEALGVNGGLICQAVPRLELIIGEQPVLDELSPVEKQTRFKTALKNWLAVISAPEHPMVFFMDDVHWADMASLDLFESLFMDQSISGLMFVGTYRDNQVKSSHPLIRTIEKIKMHNGKVELIKLDNLDIHAVEQIISDIVNRPQAEVLQLAEAVYDRTLGNPFYTIEFLKHCYDINLLHYDKNEMRWRWDEKGIDSSKISDNAADYLIQKIETLPDATRNLVKTAACLGNEFDLQVLSAVTSKDAGQILEYLKPAISEQMMIFSASEKDDSVEIKFQFCHDRFHQAGYQSLAEDIRKAIHLNIARHYETVPDQKEKNIFFMAEHFSKALDLLASDREIEQVVEVFFQAAHQANLSSAYDTARQYLELIMKIAPENLMSNDSFLLHLYTEYHLVLFSLARFEELDQTYTLLEGLARDPLDLLDCCCLQVISLSNRSRYQEGFFLGIALLEKLGIKYPHDWLPDVVEAEFEKYRTYERDGSIDAIEEKEMLQDPRGKAIAKLLNRIVPAAQFFNPLAAFWASLTNTNLMIENGLTGAALEMSWGLLMGIIAYKNDFRCGNMLAKKAVKIIEKAGFHAELYRIYHIKGLVNCHWFEPLERDIYYAHEAYRGNLQNGEFEFSCFSFFTSLTAVMESCGTIAEMQNEVEAALCFASKIGNLYGLQSFVSFQQIVKALLGETSSYGSFNDGNFDEEKHEQDIRHNAIGLAYYYIYRALCATLFGDYTTAFNLTEKAVIIIPYIASFYTSALLRFLHSLAICKVMETPAAAARAKLFDTLNANQKWMNERAQDAPFNFQHLYDLVEAEIKALEKRYDESFRLYEKAISGARESNRSYHYALACEMAGQKYCQTGIDRIAAYYLKEAYSAYLAWGATGKTEAMKQQYPDILFSGIDSAKLIAAHTDVDILSNSIDISFLSNSIDISAVFKATQVISGELERRKLLEKLMSIIIENSGSNRGHILIRDDDHWILSIYGTACGVIKATVDYQEIYLENSISNYILPVNIITYVIRTREPLIIGNITTSQFSADKYFSNTITSSVMCFPILLQNSLKGIIYLENDLSTEAFNPERLQLLNILASQAAISLENAYLYSELEKKVVKRTSQLQHEIAGHKKTEIALRESEERFSKAFHSSPVMMAILRIKDTSFIEVNQSFLRESGYERQDIIGHSPLNRQLWTEAEQEKLSIDAVNGHQKVPQIECKVRTKSGDVIDTQASTQHLNLNKHDCLLIVMQNMSAQKQYEANLYRMERLNLIGEMAAGIGHEIRNPMTAIRGFLQLLRGNDVYEKDHMYFELMIEELDRANAIISEYLGMAKDKSVDLQFQNLDQVVKSIYPIIQADAAYQGMDAKLTLGNPPMLLIDEKEIRQLILNMTRNGLEAMSPGGILTIGTAANDNEIVLFFRDQGCGLDPDMLDKLGTPFTTTKENGTGLGLAVCYSIAARHNAEIEVETCSTGTTFRVRFPIPT